MAGESRQSAAEFWQKYDAGVWKETPEDTPENDADKAPAEEETEPAKEESSKESPATSDNETKSKDEAESDEPSKSEDRSFCCDWSFEFLLPPCRPDMVLPDEGTLG